MKLLLILLSAVTTAVAATHRTGFDNSPAGLPPPGWLVTQTGRGQARWTVEQDPTAPSKPNVLKQSGVASFPLCVKDGTSLKDGFVEVKFKPVSGKEDQAGGVVWRYLDNGNYYVARANALEDNLTIYHTIKGRRVAFKNINVPVAGQTWHTLRVDFSGNKFVVALDGKELIEATDDSLAGPGKIGLWTKADSLTLFDNFSYGSSGR